MESSSGNLEVLQAIFAGVFICGFLFFVLATLWKLYTKAGQPGWVSIVPIYNLIVLMRIVGKPDWWFLLLLIPIANIYFGVVIANRLSKSFGKDELFAVGLVFLRIIFLAILAFGNAKYIGTGGKKQPKTIDDVLDSELL